MNSTSPETVNSGRVFAVTAVICASSERLYDLVSDPSRHAFLDGSGTVTGGANACELHVGDVFTMPMHLGFSYVTRNLVIEADRPRQLAWQTLAPEPADKIATGRTWRYEFLKLDATEQHEHRTLVRHSCDSRTEKLLTLPLVAAMRTKILRNMACTVTNMATTVAADLTPVRFAGTTEPLEDVAAGLPT